MGRSNPSNIPEGSRVSGDQEVVKWKSVVQETVLLKEMRA